MDILKRMKEAEKNAPTPKPEDYILEQFNKGAPEYWGIVSKIHIYHNRTTGQGTEYFLIIANTDKNGVKGKLLQEWYVSKKGEARVNPKRTMWIADSLVDEIGIIMDE